MKWSISTSSPPTQCLHLALEIVVDLLWIMIVMCFLSTKAANKISWHLAEDSFLKAWYPTTFHLHMPNHVVWAFPAGPWTPFFKMALFFSYSGSVFMYTNPESSKQICLDPQIFCWPAQKGRSFSPCVFHLWLGKQSLFWIVIINFQFLIN